MVAIIEVAIFFIPNLHQPRGAFFLQSVIFCLLMMQYCRVFVIYRTNIAIRIFYRLTDIR